MIGACQVHFENILGSRQLIRQVLRVEKWTFIYKDRLVKLSKIYAKTYHVIICFITNNVDTTWMRPRAQSYRRSPHSIDPETLVLEVRRDVVVA